MAKAMRNIHAASATIVAGLAVGMALPLNVAASSPTVRLGNCATVTATGTTLGDSQCAVRVWDHLLCASVWDVPAVESLPTYPIAWVDDSTDKRNGPTLYPYGQVKGHAHINAACSWVGE